MHPKRCHFVLTDYKYLQVIPLLSRNCANMCKPGPPKAPQSPRFDVGLGCCGPALSHHFFPARFDYRRREKESIGGFKSV